MNIHAFGQELSDAIALTNSMQARNIQDWTTTIPLLCTSLHTPDAIPWREIMDTLRPITVGKTVLDANHSLQYMSVLYLIKKVQQKNEAYCPQHAMDLLMHSMDRLAEKNDEDTFEEILGLYLAEFIGIYDSHHLQRPKDLPLSLLEKIVGYSDAFWISFKGKNDTRPYMYAQLLREDLQQHPNPNVRAMLRTRWGGLLQTQPDWSEYMDRALIEIVYPNITDLQARIAINDQCIFELNVDKTQARRMLLQQLQSTPMDPIDAPTLFDAVQ